jgi:uncharacterized protein YecT (DUF1311 family)
MRLAAALVFLASLLFSAVAQQPATKPKKVLTPEQQEYQTRMREVWVQSDALRTKAKAAFDNEMAREKAGDCPNAMSTYDINVCYSNAAWIADNNLKDFDDALRAILGLHEPKMPGQLPLGGTLAGPTPEQRVAEFDKVEAQWSAYADTACTAASNQYYGGTIAPYMHISCHIRLVRNHLRELNFIYEVTHPH